MKNLIKKIGQNKFQFFFSLGLACLLLGALVIGKAVQPSDDPIIDQPNVEQPDNKPGTDESPNVNVKPEEVFKLPFNETMQYNVVRKFYEKNASVADQQLSLIKYNNSYRTSNGTSFADKSNNVFGLARFLKYFVGLNFSALNSIGFVVNNGPI